MRGFDGGDARRYGLGDHRCNPLLEFVRRAHLMLLLLLLIAQVEDLLFKLARA